MSQPSETYHARDLAGAGRDRAGLARDTTATLRDLDSARRDVEASVRDDLAAAFDTLDMAQVLEMFSQSRREASADRRLASEDRRASARDRSDARLDRDQSGADRQDGAAERTFASVDVLTGAYERAAGLSELTRDVARARRNDEPLTVAYLDVNGLKAANDARGHAAGDRVLVQVVEALRANLRGQDLIIRLGGDEFLCAFSAMPQSEALERFERVSSTMAAASEHASVTVGFATLEAEDTIEDLIARADAAFYAARRGR